MGPGFDETVRGQLMAGKYDALAEEFAPAPVPAASPVPANDVAPAPVMPAAPPAEPDLSGALAPSPMAEPAPVPVSDLTPAPFNPNIPPSKYDGLVAEETVLQQPKVIAALLAAKEADPALYERAEKLIGGDERMQLPAEMVARNIETLEQQQRITKLRETLSENPQLAEWFGRGANSKLVTVDELKHTTGLAWLFKSSAAAFSSGWQDTTSNYTRYDQMMGVANPDDVAAADRFTRTREADPEAQKFGADGWLESGWVGLAGSVIPMIDQLGRGAARGVQYGAVGAVGGAIAGPTGAAFGARAGFAVGNLAGQYEAAFKQGAGMAWDEFRQFRGTDGKQLDPETAKSAALVSGAIEGVINVWGTQKVLEQIPGLDILAGAGVRNVVKSVLESPTQRELLTKYAKQIGGNAGLVALVPVLTEATRELVGAYTKSDANAKGGTFEQKNAGDIAGRLYEAGIAGLQMGTILAPALAIPGFRRDLSNAKMAEQHATVIADIIARSAEDKLVARLPNKAAELVAALKADTGISEIHVPADKLQEVFQSVDGASWMDNLERHLPEGRLESFQEAIASGGDIPIAIETFYAHLAPRYGEALAPHVRMDKDGATQFEAATFNDAWQETMAALGTEEATRAKLEREAGAPANQVFTDVRDRLMSSGFAPQHADHYATIYGSFFRTLADKTGMDAKSLYDRYGFDVRRVMPEVQEFAKVDTLDVNLGAMQRFAKAFVSDKGGVTLSRASERRGNLLDFIVGRGGLFDEGGDVRSRDGHLYRRGKLIAKVDPDTGRPLDKYGNIDSKYETGVDDTATAAWEAGYFPELSEPPTRIELLNAIEDGLSGNHRFNQEKVDIRNQGSFNARQGEMLKHMLETSSLSMEEIATLPIPELRRLLEERAAEEDASRPAPDRETVMDPLLARELDDFLEAATGSRELFQFAGTEARTTDKAAVKRVFEMEEAGAFPDEIYEETGFFRGVDGRLRFEISDADAKLYPSARMAFNESPAGMTSSLYRILDHPKLFEAYPEIKNIQVEFRKAAQEGGYWEEGKLFINAEAPTLDKARSILLHEIAHVIQDIEGFAQGGNLSMGELYEGDRVKKLTAGLGELQETYRRAKMHFDRPDLTPEVRAELEAGMNDVADKMAATELNLVKAAKYEFYQRIAGEVEARNVQKRARMQPKVDERNANWAEALAEDPAMLAEFLADPEKLAAPWETQDVQNPEQIVIVRSAGREGYAAHVGREPEPAPPRELFQSQTGDVRKGSLQIMDGEHLVSLFEKADLSTFLHETGHFFLEVYRDLAARGEMPDAVRADWDKISAYLELTDGEIPTVAHEKFARTFEAYLFEGKAPSADLASAFNRFKSWLGFVYRKITSLGVEPNDEIRGVMDRMLASDAEIEAQTRSAEYKPLPDELKLMNKEEREKYLALVEVAKEQARDALTRKTLAEVARETSKEWRDQKSAIREEVTDEFSQMPVYQAVEFIRTGKFIGADGDRFGDIGMMKLDKDALLSMYGPGILQKLPRAVPPLYVNKGGVHPDVIAELFGYQSGHQMVEAMMSAPPFRRAIVDEVNARMKARHGDLMNDQAAMSAAAVDALHEGDRAPILRAEYEALAKRSAGSNPKTLTPLMMMRDAARDIIGRKNIAEATRVATYDGQEARAARRVEQALAAGDFKTAAEWKQKQLFAHVLAQEARRAKTDTQKAADYLNRFTGNKRPPSVDPGYLDQIDAILERFDLRKGVGDTRLARERRKSLQEFLNEEELAGEMLSIDEAFKSDAYRQHFREMAVDDFRALADTIKNLEHVGKLKNKLLLKGKAVAFENARDELKAHIEKSRPARAVQKNQSRTMGESAAHIFNSGLASVLKIEQAADWVDGKDNIHGPFRRLIWDQIKASRYAEQEKLTSLVGEIINTLDELPTGRLSEKFNIRSVHPDFHMTRGEIYGVVLNMGTESNLSKLKRGGNQHGEFTDAHLADMMAHLSREDTVAISKMWKVVGSLWPEIAAQQKRMTGLEPEKVEARKVVTPHGVLEGGYWPLVYDAEKPGTLDVEQRASVERLMPSASPNRPVTAHGFTKARVENYARPIKLDISVASEHLREVVHDLSFRETLRDAFKLLNDKQITDAFEKHYGREIAGQFVPWLQAIAKDGSPLANNEWMDNLARKARANATILGIGYRVTTILAQPAGLFSGAAEIGPMAVANGMRMYFGTPASMDRISTWVREQSGEMRNRHSNLDRDINDGLRAIAEGGRVRRNGKNWWVAAMNEILGGNFKGTLADAKAFAFHGIGWIDKHITMPIWIGAYHQHLAKHPGDEAGAISQADRVVRISQGSGAIEDQARVQRGTEIGKLATTFWTYWGAFLNRMWNFAGDVKTAVQERDIKALPELMARSFFMWAAPAVLGDFLTGKGPDEKKEEEFLPWAMKKVMIYPFMAPPLVRELAAMADRGQTSVGASPLGRIMESGGRVAADAVRAATSDAPMDRGKVARHAIDAVGLVGGLPIGQIGILTQNIFDAIDKNGGQFAPRDIVFPHKR